MSGAFNQLISSFDKAIQKKSKDKFEKSDVQEIYKAASEFFNDEYNVKPDQVDTIRDKWVTLAEGHIDKSRATAKLQGTSRAEAIQSVLQSMLKKK